MDSCDSTGRSWNRQRKTEIPEKAAAIGMTLSFRTIAAA